MQHFGIAKIVDYVRGLASPDENRLIESHISQCAKCRARVATFAKVAAAASHESGCAPPEADVHCAKALFSLQQLSSIEFGFGRKARLVFDSFGQPEPAGIRRSGRSSRQTVYAVDDLSIDLRQQLQPNDSLVRLTGQVLSKTAAHAPVAGVEVSLLSASAVVATRKTNAFGEFDLMYAPKPRLRLLLASDRMAADRRPEFLTD